MNRRQLLQGAMALGPLWWSSRWNFGYTPPPPKPNVTIVARTGDWVNTQFDHEREHVRVDGIRELKPRSDFRWVNAPDPVTDPTNWHIPDGMRRVPLDSSYRVPLTRADLVTMVAWTQEYAKWMLDNQGLPLAVDNPDLRDCEDWVEVTLALLRWVLLCNGVGMVLDFSSVGGTHGYLLALVADGPLFTGNFYVVEATDGTVFSMEEKSDLYPLLQGQLWL